MENRVEQKFRLREFKIISHAISTYEDLPLLVKHIVEGLVRTFKIKGCSIFLYDEREKQLYCMESYGISNGYLTKGPIFVDNQYSSFFTGEPVFVNDLQNDPRVQDPETAAKEGFVALASFPIKYRSTIVGCIRLYHDRSITLHPDDVDSICILAQHLGLVIENNGLRNCIEEVRAAFENLPSRLLKGLQ